MFESPMSDTHKRALIIAFYLSKFDRRAVRSLGYGTFNDAFNDIGRILGVKPATIKNMRDQFDPLCSSGVRKGWYQRPLTRSRVNVIEAYGEYSESAMMHIAEILLHGKQERVSQFILPVSTSAQETVLSIDDNPYAARLRTGESAENYFMSVYPRLSMFTDCSFEDTRKLGIGYDFRASFIEGYFAIEVKGILDQHGMICFTDSEWRVASILADNYILALVRSIKRSPVLELIANPTETLDANMKSIPSNIISWNARV